MMHYIKLNFDDNDIVKLKDNEIPKAIEIYIVASHTDIPINMRIYKPEEFLKQIDSWTEPFKKPILIHHDTHSDAIGRVVSQQYVTKQQWDAVKNVIAGKNIPFPEHQSGQIILKGYIVDEQQIKKILNGIYTTVSIGFDQEMLECSYCGGNIFECGHEPGEDINGETVYSVPRNIRFREISFVNQPADDYAGVIKIKPVDFETAISQIGNLEIEEPEESEKPQYVLNNKEVKNTDQSYSNKEKNGDSNQNDKDSVRREIKMDELKQAINMIEELKKEISEMKESITVVKNEKETLEEKYNKLYKELKDMYLKKIIAVKLIIAGELTDEEENEMTKKILEEYKDASIEELKVVEKELSSLVNKLFDEECENCEKDEDQKVNSKEDEEFEQKQAEEAKDEAKEEMNNDEIEKPEKPETFSYKDQSEAIFEILGIKK